MKHTRACLRKSKHMRVYVRNLIKYIYGLGYITPVNFDISY